MDPIAFRLKGRRLAAHPVYRSAIWVWEGAASVPLAFWATALSTLSLLWALACLFHLYGLVFWLPGQAAAALHWLLKNAWAPGMVLGLMAAATDEEHRRVGLIGACVGGVALVTWAVTDRLLGMMSSLQ